MASGKHKAASHGKSVRTSGERHMSLFRRNANNKQTSADKSADSATDSAENTPVSPENAQNASSSSSLYVPPLSAAESNSGATTEPASSEASTRQRNLPIVNQAQSTASIHSTPGDRNKQTTSEQRPREADTMSSTDPAESQLPVEPQLSVDPQQSSAQTADDPSTPSTPSDSATVNGNSADSAASGSVDSGVASSDNNDSDTKTAPVPLYDADGNPVPFQEQVKYVYVERRPDLSKRATGPAWQIMGIVAETLFTMALVCVLYIVWLMGWTGVVAQHKQDEQMQSAAWSDPSKGKNKRLASKQDGEPPVQPINPKVGDLIGAVYIPRFGNQWMRTVVEGTDKPQLNEHGIGHYPQTQMPGQIGNFAAAGHRNGYGQPLGDIDKLKEGDPIVIRTKDYWYVYEYTDHTVVTPDQVGVVAPNPRSPMLAPTQRMITLTTCEPKYSKPTHRWVAFGKLTYWAKVADGIPEELARTNQNGEIEFYNNSKRMETKLPVDSLVPFITSCLTVYAVIYLAAAVVWRWPRRREIRQHLVRKPDISIYGGLSRLQPGPTLIRVLLVLILMVAGGAALFEWVFPWAAETLPLLEQMTNVAF